MAAAVKALRATYGYDYEYGNTTDTICMMWLLLVKFNY